MHRAAAAAAAVADDLATAAAAAADAAAAAATDGDGAAAASAAAAAVVAGAVAGEIAVEAEVEQVLTEAVEQVVTEAVAATAAAAGEGEGGEGEGEAAGGGEGESGARSGPESGAKSDAKEARRRRLSHAALLPAEMATRWGAAEAQGAQWYVWNDFALATATEAEVLSLHAEWRRPCVLVYAREGLSERLSQLPLDAPELASRLSSMTGAFSLQQPPTVVPPERARAITPLAAHELPPKAGQLVAIDAEFVAVTHELTRPGKTAGKTIVVKPARLSLARVSILRGSGTMAGVPFIDAYVQQACAMHRLHLCMHDLRHLACAAAPHANLHAHLHAHLHACAPHAHLHMRCTGRAGGRLPDPLLGAAPGRPRPVGLAPPHHHDEGGLPAAAPAGRCRLPLRRPRAAEGLRDDQRRRAARPDHRHGRAACTCVARARASP